MKKLSIAMYGNTNNYPLMLAEGFQELGHHVRLIVNRKELLHRPEGRHPEWAGAYPDWIHDCSHIDEFDIAYESQAIDEVISLLTHQVDFVILNDLGPAFASYLTSPHAAVLTGSDLTYYANFQSIELRSSTLDPAYRRLPTTRRLTRKLTDLVARQREGILTAKVVSHGARGLIAQGDQLLDSIGVLDDQRMMVYLSDTANLAFSPMPRNDRLKIFCGSRVVWQQNASGTFSEIDMKGTDILINGFAMYCRQGGSGILHLPNKGADVEAAKQLIKNHGIEDQVVWYENMPLHEFVKEMAESDIVCDQFAQSFPGLVATQAYALGRPVLANFRKDILDKVFSAPMPGLNATKAEQVSELLLMVDRDRSILRELGKDSRRFAEGYLSPPKMAMNLLKMAGLTS